MRESIIIDGRKCLLCILCGQPMRPKGVRKKPEEFNHARGCAYGPPAPCPICKRKPYLVSFGKPKVWRIVCDSHNHTLSIFCNRRLDAVRQWNRMAGYL